MKDDATTDIYVCMAVRTLPHVESSRKVCADCSRDVWVDMQAWGMASSVAAKAGKRLVINCERCAGR